MMRNSSILHKILINQYDFCCLCLNQINIKLRIEDEVLLKNDQGELSIRILDVLQHVLGEDICNIVSTFQGLCKMCANTAIKCYTFLIKAKENCKILKNYVEGLSEKLNNTGNYYSRSNSLFITYDSQNNIFEKFFDVCKIDFVSAATKRLNTLLQDTKIEVKSEPNIHYELNQFDVKKKKRKHYVDSVKLKTRDMLCNKNDASTLKCKICMRVYPCLSNLRNHFIRVHAPKKYKCTICSKKFGSLSLVEAHEDESHCKLICKDCGKTFSNRHSLKVHEVGHYLRIVCPDCGRVYKSRTTYKKHKDLDICSQKSRASSENAKFTCDYCNKRYTQKVSLRVHIQYEHGNYKSHECKWCKKKFFAPSRLKAHIVTHTQEKKYSCTTCGGKFVSKESLLYHTRTHTGEKPFKCEFCDKRFLSASRRTDHRKRHHPTQSFQCKICDAKYNTWTCLQKHMKSHVDQSTETVDTANDL
ncbi:zinc finger protein 878-like [Aricia agestis]|uniref:zinc finger protein 878-like n=1 Tax=Aricia agestis TaxID=91739 RepID=UPI001C2063FE|nr:zinc finger protein 878-like [Aricia agestis]